MVKKTDSSIAASASSLSFEVGFIGFTQTTRFELLSLLSTLFHSPTSPGSSLRASIYVTRQVL